jgi:hypothetical protein
MPTEILRGWDQEVRTVQLCSSSCAIKGIRYTYVKSIDGKYKIIGQVSNCVYPGILIIEHK